VKLIRKLIKPPLGDTEVGGGEHDELKRRVSIKSRDNLVRLEKLRAELELIERRQG